MLWKSALGLSWYSFYKSIQPGHRFLSEVTEHFGVMGHYAWLLLTEIYSRPLASFFGKKQPTDHGSEFRVTTRQLLKIWTVHAYSPADGPPITASHLIDMAMDASVVDMLEDGVQKGAVYLVKVSRLHD